ncbi:MAG TPA: HWE histidine kinase domain-containing protein, partial [Caulobacteraceae bacterium]
AIYTTDAAGRITHFNPAAVEFSGRTPELGTDRWCVSWKLYHPDGSPMPHDECPMAIALNEGRVVGGAKVIVERPDGTRRWIRPFPSLLRDREGRVVGGVNMLVDITEGEQAERHQQLLVNELNHRVKNTLATVQSIAAQTFRGSDIDPRFPEAFEARLIALSNAHGLLTQSNWEGAEIGDVVRQTVEPHAGPERIHVRGPSVRLTPKAALAIAMGMHELATNAAKYGALSNRTGWVEVTWSVDGPEPGALNLQWAESGGPPVKKPGRKGFGSRMIERNLAYDLDGQARIDYRPEGIVCTITSPLAPPAAEVATD